jgi:hypothetical protein
VTAHVVMPARRSHVPDHWVRRCTGCGWTAYRTDRDELAELVRAHQENPGSDDADTGGQP